MNKRPIFDWFYTQGDVLISVNTHMDGVEIPSHLRQQEVVDFILGENPTPKMTGDEVGVSAAMRFSGSLHSCYFPWSSVVQMSGKDAVIQFRNPMLNKDTAENPEDLKQEGNGKKGRANLRLIK